MTSKDNDGSERKSSRVSTDDLYRRSTQFKLWSFTKDELETIRKSSNEKGKTYANAKFDKVYERIKAEQTDIFSKYGGAELSKNVLVDLITLQEERKYLNFYSKNIIQAANFFQMPTQVKASAMAFFKRFYLFNSVMQYHPKYVLYTCLFLAAKSENYFISINSFCEPLQKTEPKDVLDLEFIVLQSLKFTIMVHHPFRPLYGFFLDFQEVLLQPSPASSDITIDKIGQLYDQAKKWLNDHGLISDVSFFYTPPQIALAAMYDSNPRITEKYLRRKFLKDKEPLNTIKEEEPDGVDAQQKDSLPPKGTEVFDLLVKTIRKCVEDSKTSQESTLEESTKIGEKCFFANNPEKLINKKIKKLKKLEAQEQESPQEAKV
ncbi:hypothetical protein PSN45_002429 [Yamadazyma tenuis]|uniref:Cyclin-like domain-containing protein n=1 Tax=Candida tenuis (strain ATCC 10573 / BCRC 21748 / CBS 615 / JCM 9827 / NBRC 10315 / NRRL Y-1498 / VKM Y-70) TaxID=590646 RepID=G3B0H7_CANTC|nr:uncharacterized protein CANTEDRAFT_119767 [Yamadazyma tenuis ATCC 10573]EGV65404.1 hypothetical protein CANTEDRAFT_119767 [Yamadazyma tenuis ATCC 10573]WEJ94927.1 hypothetical protein PSN45_002429 [Yamadazyma tenuis]